MKTTNGWILAEGDGIYPSLSLMQFLSLNNRCLYYFFHNHLHIKWFSAIIQTTFVFQKDYSHSEAFQKYPISIRPPKYSNLSIHNSVPRSIIILSMMMAAHSPDFSVARTPGCHIPGFSVFQSPAPLHIRSTPITQSFVFHPLIL